MNVDFYLSILIIFLVSFLAAFLPMKRIIRKIRDRGFLVPDINKQKKPLIPDMGGIGIMLGFVLGALISLQLQSASLDITHMLAAISSIILISLLGLLDDVLNLPDRYRVVLPIFASLPLVVTKAGTASINLIFFDANLNLGTVILPILGPLDLNLYALLLIPIGVVACSNLINLLGGFNGLEAGVGSIVSLSIFISSIILRFRGLHTTETSFLMIALFAACLAFLFFNWFPARIFPGNITTYMIGASVVGAVVIGNMERVGVIALTPQIIEFFLKARSKFKAENFGKFKNGKLYYEGKIYSLTHLFMRYLRPSEEQLVTILLLLQSFFGLLAISSLYW